MKALDALNRLNNIAFSFYTAGAFAAASNLKIFDHLKENPLTPAKLATRIHIHPDSCQRLLSSMEYFELLEQRNGSYINTELGNYLTSDAEYPMGFNQHDYYFYHMWEFLPDALREYSPRHEQAWNQSAQELYQAIYGNEGQMRQFFRLLDSYNWPIGEEVADRLNFSPYNCILDVAGGTGTFAATVVKRHQHLKGITLDLEPVRKLSEEMIANQGLHQRFQFIAGDMFENNYPEGADAIFLSYVLHNWSDEKCLRILNNCYLSLPSKGMLVISEKVLNNDFSGDWWGVMMNLQMLIAFEPGAKERTEAEYIALLDEAGFVDVELIRLDAPRDILVAYKT